MAQNINLWFDKEANFLEFSFGSRKKGFFNELKDDIFERVDLKGKVIGFAIFNFLKTDKVEQKIALPVELIVRNTKKKRV